MTTSELKTEVLVRGWRDEDEPDVLRLLQDTLGGGPAGTRPVEFFRWKHMDNPFGHSYMLVAEVRGRIVGFRSFMRWRFIAGDQSVAAVRAVDTATHADYQGRGIFSLLTRQAIAGIREEADLIFNTPNEKSLPGYLKMGWEPIGAMPIRVRPVRPVRIARGMRSINETLAPLAPSPEVRAEKAAEALADPIAVDGLIEEARLPGDRLATDRDATYLRWRYASAPLLDYRAIREVRGGVLRGLALFRVRPRGRLQEATIAELLVERGDRRTAMRLLRRVRKASSVDHITASFPSDSTQAASALRAGFFKAPRGLTMVVNPLREGLMFDPTDPQAWALGLGDLEVF
jgi:hypothetical protein